MKIITITALGLIVFAVSLFAQSPDTVWTRSYSTLGNARAATIVQAPGGGYFVGGMISHDSIGDINGYQNTDYWVLRLDEQGDTLWTRSYGDSLLSETVAQLAVTSDGGYVIAGNRNRHHPLDEIYVVKADVWGEPQWEAIYPTNGIFPPISIGQNINDDFVLVFNTVSGSINFSMMQIYGGWGVDLEHAGNETFRISYSWALDDWATAMTITSDNGFAICGVTKSRGNIPEEELFIMKSSEYGIVEWTRIYDPPFANSPRAIKQTVDGGFIVVGSSNASGRKFYILRTNSDGDKIWSRSYKGSGGLDVIELKDGGFLATGWDGFTTRISSSGEQIWSDSYGGSLFSVAMSPDGGYVMAGWNDKPGDGRSAIEVYVVKLAPDGIVTEVDDDLADLYPLDVNLAQNYPNPFNPSTTIEFTLPRLSPVKIEIFNILGQKVRTLVDEIKSAGSYRVDWNGNDATGMPVAMGIYLYHLRTGDHEETKKMVLLK